VQTTRATTADLAITATIHSALAHRQVLPSEHYVASAYPDAARLVSSRETHALDLVGPVHRDSSWQAQAKQGFDIACCVRHSSDERNPADVTSRSSSHEQPRQLRRLPKPHHRLLGHHRARRIRVSGLLKKLSETVLPT
jgi:hypothetical protein